MFRSAGHHSTQIVQRHLVGFFEFSYEDHAAQSNEGHSRTGYSHGKIAWRFFGIISVRSLVVANDATRMRGIARPWLVCLVNCLQLSPFLSPSGDMPWNFPSRLWLCVSQSKLHGFRSKHEICCSNFSIVLPRAPALRTGKL